MRTLELFGADAAVRIAGILDVRPLGDGAGLSRLAPWTRDQIVDPALQWVATMPSGGRIDLVSDTAAVEVDLQLTRLAYEDRAPLPAGVDLVVDGDLVAGERLDAGHLLHFPDRRSMDFDLIAGGPSTVRFDGLPSHAKRLEVWLPNNAAVDLLAVRLEDAATVEAPPPPTRRWVHYGSSISHCIEAERPTGVWPVVAARAARVDLQSLAIAGQAQLDQFAARTIRDLDVDLISLKVGINVVNADSLRERTFVPAVHGFLDTIRDGHPSTPLVLITPIICPVVETTPGPTATDDDGQCFAVERTPASFVGSLTLERIRTLLTEVVAARRTAGDARLHLLDGMRLFGPADVGDLPDGLHPNAAGYQRMGERFGAWAFAEGGPFAAP